MLFFIFYLLYFVLGDDPKISESAEVCVENSKFCDYKPVSKKEQILPKCGKHFSSIKDINKIGLSEWLIREMFCLVKNGSDYKSINDPDSTLTNAPDNKELSKKRQVIKKPKNYPESITFSSSKIIEDTNEEQYFIPAPFLASSSCNTKIRKIDIDNLTPIDSLKCYYTNDDAQNISNTFNYSNIDIDYGNCKEEGKLKSINLRFIYDRSENKTKIIKLYQNCTYHDDLQVISNKEYYLQVNVHFYQQDKSPDISNKEIKSGGAGYSDGKPLIALNSKSRAASQFPIPFGFDCSKASYTPLLFGYDTISGCTENSEDREVIIQNLTKFTHVAQMGRARGNYERDWISISGINEISKDCSNLQLIINYDYVGNTKNPQNRIYNASYTCRSTGGKQFLFLVNFLRSSDDSSKAFIPKPKGLPDDTFAPLIN